jgi:hypothetical protein
MDFEKSEDSIDEKLEELDDAEEEDAKTIHSEKLEEDEKSETGGDAMSQL